MKPEERNVGAQFMAPPADAQPVSVLVRQLRWSLEGGFSRVVVIGEVSGLSRPVSGHWYFDLKDEQAVLPAVMWRSQVLRHSWLPRDGDQVVVCGRVTVYEPRGRMQLAAETVSPHGLGSLRQALRELKARLEREGLFAPERKRALPFWPRLIGVITSPSGAVIHDILTTIARRCPRMKVRIFPVRVQGKEAAAEVAAALSYFNNCPDPPEVVIVARGGGSLEDLWAFNEEAVVRAVSGSLAPVVSAVGHEVDVTLCDLVADLRAPTPTAAAELVVPLEREVRERLHLLTGRLARSLSRRVEEARGRIVLMASRRVLSSPSYLWEERRQRLDDWQERMRRELRHGLDLARERFRGLEGKMRMLDPRLVLRRGYAMVTREGLVVTDSEQVAAGEVLTIELSKGKLSSTVEQIWKE